MIDALRLRHDVDEGILLEAQNRLKESGENTPQQLARILTTEFNIPHDYIYGTLADLYAFRRVTIKQEEMDEKTIKQARDLLNEIPEELRNKLLYNKILPYQVLTHNREILQVLAADPTTKLVLEIPTRTRFKRYEIIYCPLNNINDLINHIAPRKNEFLELLEETNEMLDDESDDMSNLNEEELDATINKSRLVNLFEGALIEAVRKGVSDIHIIPSGKSSVDIYFREDGKLQLWHRQESTPPEALSAVVKDRSVNIDRFERDASQDGFAQRVIDQTIIRFRVSVMPIVSSEYERRFESIVIRVIDDRKVITDFRKLGLQEQAERELLKSINQSSGMVIITGPTGSGKSFTLVAALYHVIDPTKNILTCEEPVEYVIKGARQLKISQKMTFDMAIRGILRHDPDIVMVGEIRDKKTAEIGVKLANTGHLTFSTLHTNDAPSVLSRLFKMGIEPFLLAYSINIIIAQRLVRKVCPVCKQPLDKEKWIAALELGVSQDDLDAGLIYQANPKGCSKCNAGYKGRAAISEALYFYPEVREAIIRSGNEIDEGEVKRIAQSKGMLTIRQSGVEAMRQGITTLTEVAYATTEG
ncbi:MAG: GspE/PulE family protein [Candidatus Cloacimonetes bacterium]|nr:GspE/PulE family protein [Candidatus Cloacimonadota bacterium]